MIDPLDNAAVTKTPACSEHYIPQGQGRVYARDYPGAAPAFVVMHGLPDNSRIYDDLIPYLVAAGRRVIAFDFLGFGVSDKPDNANYGFEQQLRDLHCVVNYFAVDKFIPVVHDSSGPTGLNFAIDNPGRVDSLVVLNSPYGEAPTRRWPEFVELFTTKTLGPLALAIAQSPAQFGWMLNWQRDQFTLHLPESQRAHFREFIGPLIEENFTKQPGAGLAFIQMTAELNEKIALDTQRYPELEALRLPVKIIWGKYDPYINSGMAKELKSHLPQASLEFVEAGHWLQSDAPAQVARLMLQR
jgi:haloalkane dehalogenase